MGEKTFRNLQLTFSVLLLIIPVLGYYFLNWDARISLMSMNISVACAALSLCLKTSYQWFLHTLFNAFIVNTTPTKKGFIGLGWLLVFLFGMCFIIGTYLFYMMPPIVLIELYLNTTYQKNISNFDFYTFPADVRLAIISMMIAGVLGAVQELLAHIKCIKTTKINENYFWIMPAGYLMQPQIKFQIGSMFMVFIGMIVVSFFIDPKAQAFNVTFISSMLLNVAFVFSKYYYAINDAELYKDSLSVK